MRTHIWTNNALLHPIRAIKMRLRRWLQSEDAGADPLWTGGEIPKYLEPFQVGESLPWKGVQFRVGKVVGGDFPMVILVPVDRTHGHKLRTLRTYRDIQRHDRAHDKATAGALSRQAR